MVSASLSALAAKGCADKLMGLLQKHIQKHWPLVCTDIISNYMLFLFLILLWLDCTNGFHLNIDHRHTIL